MENKPAKVSGCQKVTPMEIIETGATMKVKNLKRTMIR